MMKVTIEVSESHMLNMLCNATYGNDYLEIVDGEGDKVSEWVKKTPNAMEGYDLAECWEPRVFAYLKANKDHEFKFLDTYSEDVVGLTWENMCGGMLKMSADQVSHMSDLLEGRDDYITADVWLQCSLFGDVIYG